MGMDGEKLLHRQVQHGIRSAILAARLAPGDRIPSTRALSKALGVSRNTIVVAIEQLTAEGYLSARVGSGTFVSSRPAVALPAPKSTPAAAQPKEAAPLSSTASILATLGTHTLPPAKAFTLGLPDITKFPFDVWARLLAKAWRNPQRRLLLDDPMGYPPLREAIATYLTARRGLRCTADQIIVTSGVRQALNLVASVLLSPGDVVCCEEPCYSGIRTALLRSGMKVVPVPVDENGMSVGAGRLLTNEVRLITVNPARHYPLGMVMSARRRAELVRWARTADAFILENEYDSEYLYAGSSPPPLQSIDSDERVIYTGTFAKALFPSLGLGYLVAPSAMISRLAQAHWACGNHPSTVAQPVLAAFMAEGHFARHLLRMQKIYARRQEQLLRAGKRYLDGLLALAPDPGGMHLVASLTEDFAKTKTDTAASMLAAAGGVNTFSLAQYYAGRQTRQALLLGYAALDEAEIDRSAQALAHALRG